MILFLMYWPFSLEPYVLFISSLECFSGTAEMCTTLNIIGLPVIFIALSPVHSPESGSWLSFRMNELSNIIVNFIITESMSYRVWHGSLCYSKLAVLLGWSVPTEELYSWHSYRCFHKLAVVTCSLSWYHIHLSSFTHFQIFFKTQKLSSIFWDEI